MPCGMRNWAMARKAPDLPKKFRFGPYTFTIRVVEAPGKERSDEGKALNDGWTDCSRGVVYIDQTLPAYTRALVLHHECGHAIAHVFGRTGPEDEEKQEEHNINVFSTGYIMLEQENPALMDYFDYYLRNKR